MIAKAEFTSMLARKLKKLRSQSGMTQESLAGAADMSPRYIGHLESGRHLASAYTLFKIIKALKIDPKEVLSE